MSCPNSYNDDDEGGGGCPATRSISLIGHGHGYKEVREAGGVGLPMENGEEDERGAAARGLDNFKRQSGPITVADVLRGPGYKDQMREAGVVETATADSDDSLSFAGNKNRGKNQGKNKLAVVGPVAPGRLPVAVPIG
jgi:hypothetical protein